MIYAVWEEAFFAQCAGKLAKVEQKLTNVRLEYLRQYYTTNNFSEDTEVEEIATQWNRDDFDFYMDLEEWFFGRQMSDRDVAQRREESRTAAA